MLLTTERDRPIVMKRIKNALILAILSVFLFSGCGAAGIDITASSSNAKIKINGVEDGTYAEISTMSVSGEKATHIESSLNKGKLKIEFCEAIEVSAAGESEDYVAGNIAKTVEIGPGEKIDVSLDPGRYVLQLTTVGQTDGTVQISIK